MLQLVTPPERPRPALLASVGLHAMVVSAFSLGPLLAFPQIPGWQGEVWVVTQPDLSAFRAVKVDLREPAPEPRGARRAGGGGLPTTRREAPRAEVASTTQPTSVQEELPVPPDVEPTGEPWGSGDVEEATAIGPGDSPGNQIGGDAIDIRGAGRPPDIVLPVPLETPAPRYPDIARLTRTEGTVVLSATIAADGRVVDVEVEKGVSPMLDRVAVDAVSSWRYVPARLGSRAVAVILRVTLTFRLD